MKFRTQVWIYLLLVRRGLARDEIVVLQPGPPSDCGLFRRVEKLYRARTAKQQAEFRRLSRKPEVVFREWKRWKPVIESGDIGQLGPERGPDEEVDSLLAAFAALHSRSPKPGSPEAK